MPFYVLFWKSLKTILIRWRKKWCFFKIRIAAEDHFSGSCYSKDSRFSHNFAEGLACPASTRCCCCYCDRCTSALSYSTCWLSRSACSAIGDSNYSCILMREPVSVAAGSKAWVCGCSSAEILGSNPTGAWVFFCFECRVLSGRGLCDELINLPEETYRLWCVFVCVI